MGHGRGCASLGDAEMVRLGPCLPGAWGLVFPKETQPISKAKKKNLVLLRTLLIAPCKAAIQSGLAP